MLLGRSHCVGGTDAMPYVGGVVGAAEYPHGSWVVLGGSLAWDGVHGAGADGEEVAHGGAAPGFQGPLSGRVDPKGG